MTWCMRSGDLVRVKAGHGVLADGAETAVFLQGRFGDSSLVRLPNSSEASALTETMKLERLDLRAYDAT